MLGPVMIHHRKTYVTYYTLASRVAAASPKLKDVKGIVTAKSLSRTAFRTSSPILNHCGTSDILDKIWTMH